MHVSSVKIKKRKLYMGHLLQLETPQHFLFQFSFSSAFIILFSPYSVLTANNF